MEKTTIIITGLCVAVILLGGYLLYNDFIVPKIDKHNQEYFVNGSVAGYNQMILEVNQRNEVPVIKVFNETNFDWEWISLGEICNV